MGPPNTEQTSLPVETARFLCIKRIPHFLQITSNNSLTFFFFSVTPLQPWLQASDRMEKGCLPPRRDTITGLCGKGRRPPGCGDTSRPQRKGPPRRKPGRSRRMTVFENYRGFLMAACAAVNGNRATNSTVLSAYHCSLLDNPNKKLIKYGK